MPNIRPRDALIGTAVYMLIVIVALVVPASPPHLQRGYLLDMPLGRRLAGDLALNVALFVPIGWGLRRALRPLAGTSRRSMILAVVLAAAFSLAMETVQAWLPNRYSSLLDVVSNTLGATAGAWIASRSADRA